MVNATLTPSECHRNAAVLDYLLCMKGDAEPSSRFILVSLPRGSARRYVLTFGITAGVLLAFYYFPYAPGSFVHAAIDAYLRGYTLAAGTVIHGFDATTHVQGHEILGRYSLRIVRTCDAMDVNILFVSAVSAWPAPWRRRVVAALLGMVLLFAVNVARICCLYLIGVHDPAYFDLAHHELLPAAILVVTVGAFITFTAWANRPSTADPSHESG